MRQLRISQLSWMIGSAAMGLLAVQSQAANPPKPKYGPQATRLHDSQEYVRKNAAPDFWALMPYYVPQATGSACSVASVTMVVNAARAAQKLKASDELATQKSVTEKV